MRGHCLQSGGPVDTPQDISATAAGLKKGGGKKKILSYIKAFVPCICFRPHVVQLNDFLDSMAQPKVHNQTGGLAIGLEWTGFHLINK